MLIATNPIAKRAIAHLLVVVIFEAGNKNIQIIILIKPQTTFIVGEDNPLPGGVAKGVGNQFPEIPLMKWGSEFTKNKPKKKQATKLYHFIS